MAKKYILKEFKIDRLSKEPRPIKGERIGIKDRQRLEKGDSIYIYFGRSHSYVGQTKQFLTRYKQHYDLQSKFDIHNYNCVVMSFGQLINRNSLDDIENQLISYIAADGKHNEVLSDNSTGGNSVVGYPQQNLVKSDFIIPFWHDLYTRNYVQTPNLDVVQNSLLFKYSPFHQLSDVQAGIIQEIVDDPDHSFVINGMAGTGKTVMLTNLAATLRHKMPTKTVAVIVKTNWVKTAKKIFKTYGDKDIHVFTAVQFINSGKHYDYLIVDEAHRLRRYYSKSNNVLNVIFKYPEKVAEEKGTNYDPNGNELLKIVKQCKQLVLMYDPSQQIRPGDITATQFQHVIQNGNFRQFNLPTEYRINIEPTQKGYQRAFSGDNFINGIKAFLGIGGPNTKFYKELFTNYLVNGEDAYFGICNSIQELFDYLNDMRNYDPTSQNRVVAGYCRKWVSRKNGKPDWVEGEHHWNWNSRLEDWLDAPDSENEIGSIHAVQGIDLNYVGVIVGKDLTVDDNGHLVANPQFYYDSYGKFKKDDPHPVEFDRFVKNIYYVLLTRGINGIRVYFEDPKVERLFKRFMGIEK
ncbi:DNA/RNA helicase domain-containing protein [Limosilactobacillus sp.]|uniref:DNA/RNA helicase domain-containing protein n=1 Tax=Limosilactobacillus sp. TaxID=2773925 RepID=UPI0025B906BC|nr:DNA/RNA helicase domain-containing protein [Limosilactobacillus sp.]MCH3922818.1 DUF2075 domain-containing protein [Limosilactobacillus sp.]MCH3927501.1 DUF2075 domain-containing protein [Limosilactobacillus sp.]